METWRTARSLVQCAMARLSRIESHALATSSPGMRRSSPSRALIVNGCRAPPTLSADALPALSPIHKYSLRAFRSPSQSRGHGMKPTVKHLGNQDDLAWRSGRQWDASGCHSRSSFERRRSTVEEEKSCSGLQCLQDPQKSLQWRTAQVLTVPKPGIRLSVRAGRKLYKCHRPQGVCQRLRDASQGDRGYAAEARRFVDRAPGCLLPALPAASRTRACT